jgi:hypothetical protein
MCYKRLPQLDVQVIVAAVVRAVLTNPASAGRGLFTT